LNNGDDAVLSGSGDINEHLLRQVRPEDRIILDVGCGRGNFGQVLKRQRHDRIVLGTEADRAAADTARSVLDAVFEIDVENDMPAIEHGSLDCIILDSVLQRVRDPIDVLARLKTLLRPGGRAICSLPNVQHFSALTNIVSGDFQYQLLGPLEEDQKRFFGAANIQKLFLDAGFLPGLADAVRTPMSEELAMAFMPLVEHLGLNPSAFIDKTTVSHFICVASPIPAATATTGGITFVVAVTDPRLLESNLLASPVLQNDRHEIVPVVGATSAADAFHKGLSQSARRNGLIVMVHEDVYLPAGWDDRLISGIAEAERKFGAVGVAGVFGVTRSQSGSFERVGRIVDRNSLLVTAHELPISAISLDEAVLVFPVQDGSIVGIDDSLGFDLYGSEACLAAWEADQVAVVVDAPCFHNSEAGGDLGDDFRQSAFAFAAKRLDAFPYATTCVQFSGDGEARSW
jgi:2-polyprenyl-3-methyl-5-hydroxy-6-metoxy-1,4-benzoquinol methylase